VVAKITDKDSQRGPIFKISLFHIINSNPIYYKPYSAALQGAKQQKSPPDSPAAPHYL
jgi:hypothetical protein